MVTGTDVDDTPTAGLTQWTSPWRRQVPSSWIGSGKQVGVGQVVGDVLAVACLSKGRTVILTMPIRPDGSLFRQVVTPYRSGHSEHRDVDEDIKK